jgi:hypothetical protein
LDQNWRIDEGQWLFCLHLATTRPDTNKSNSLWNPSDEIFDLEDDVWFMVLVKFVEELLVFHRVGMARLKWKDYEQQGEFRNSFEEFRGFTIY